MAVKEKKAFVFNNIIMDSQEEVYVAQWLQELQDNGLVKQWKWNPMSVPLTQGLKLPFVKKTVLKTKIKYEDREKILLRPSVYTPDFVVEFTEEGKKHFVYEFDVSLIQAPEEPRQFLFATKGKAVVLEVKPEGFDPFDKTRSFVMNQKWIWDKHKMFVNLIYPTELFKETFLPLAAAPDFKYKKRYKDKLPGEWKTKYTPKTLKEFLNGK